MVNYSFKCIKTGYVFKVALDNLLNVPSCPIHRRKNCLRLDQGLIIEKIKK